LLLVDEDKRILLFKLKVAFYAERSDVSIWIHPAIINPNLSEFIFYFYLS